MKLREKLLYEGTFRKPRLWSNTELRKISHLFEGSVVNVSAWRDLDKSAPSYREYLTGDPDQGVAYRDYFTNASEYVVTNREDLDLEQELPEDLHGRFDVVFNHTTLEHVFDLFKAFENLCLLTRDVVILVVPFAQEVHWIDGHFEDYWRLTPFAIDRLFARNGMHVLHRSASDMGQSSIYYFYVASRKPDRWKGHFEPVPLGTQLRQLNTGRSMFPVSRIHGGLERIARRLFRSSKGGAS